MHIYRPPALNDNKTKHTSEIKAGVRFCAISFIVVTLPVLFRLNKVIFYAYARGIRQLTSIPFCTPPPISRFDSLIFILGIFKRLFIMKRCKIRISCGTIVRAIKCVAKLNIVFMCVVPLMVHMLRFTELIRNFVVSSV
jgi:hypothetical protein